MTNVYTHVRPDADAFGSAIGLAILENGIAWFLASDWRNRPASIRAIETQVDLLPHVHLFDQGDEAPDGQCWAVDCGDYGRISAPDSVKERGFEVSFDHHCNGPVAHTEYGGAHFPSASAAIVEHYRHFRKISPAAATLLYAGLAGDTELFSNSAATSLAHSVAAFLADRGAFVDLVNRAIKTQRLQRAKLQAKFFESLEVHCLGGFKFATTLLTGKDYKEAGAERPDYAGMPGSALLEGVDLAACIQQDGPTTFRIAFRSTPGSKLKAQACASELGGNGHPDAAGAEIDQENADVARGLVVATIKDLLLRS